MMLDYMTLELALVDLGDVRIRTALHPKSLLAAMHVKLPALLREPYGFSLVQPDFFSKELDLAVVAPSMKHPSLFPKINDMMFPRGWDMVPGTQSLVPMPTSNTEWQDLLRTKSSEVEEIVARDWQVRGAALDSGHVLLDSLMSLPPERNVIAWQAFSCTEEAHMCGFEALSFAVVSHARQSSSGRLGLVSRYPQGHILNESRADIYLLIAKDGELFVDARPAHLRPVADFNQMGLNPNPPRLEDVLLPSSVYDQFHNAAEQLVRRGRVESPAG